MPTAFFTTSWDDGHPADLKVAEMLAWHGIAGTFYIPRAIPTGVMTEPQICEVSRMGFEIGAHTLNHGCLPQMDDATARAEIGGSKQWVEQVTALPCRMFCPPAGKFAARHLAMVADAGFVGVRTVELGSLDAPRRIRATGSGGIGGAGTTGGGGGGGVVVVEMPTTVQAYPHGLTAYGKNFARRGAARNLWTFLLHGRARRWSTLARHLIERTTAAGGVFHLWGHSWELQERRQWKRLDEVLAVLSEHARAARTVTNGHLCAEAAAAAVSRGGSGRSGGGSADGGGGNGRAGGNGAPGPAAQAAMR